MKTKRAFRNNEVSKKVLMLLETRIIIDLLFCFLFVAEAVKVMNDKNQPSGEKS